MNYRKNSDLVPLAAIVNRVDSTTKQELEIQDRLSRSWMLVVGPILVHQTCLIRIHRGIMLIGCWHYDIIGSLRQSAEATWPQIQTRLAHLWKIKLHGLEVVPCDPPMKSTYIAKISNQETDTFVDVLDLLRKQKNHG